MSSRRVKMWPTASVKACWLCVVLAAVPALSGHIVYKKVGDEVVLKPDSVLDTITSITWRHGANLAIEWEKNDNTEKNDITYYRHFEERGSLNTSNGEMTITGLFRNDSGGYTVEINNKITSIDLRVISAVPEPTVSPSCDEKTSCTLTCEGNTTGAEPVTYTWKSDDTVITTSTQKQHAIEEDSSSIKQFSCELKNPVSQESSKPIPNPLIINHNSPEEGLHPKINTGVTVFICLLVPLLLLVFIHRCKAGMWFYEKESMPWEGAFWRKNEKKHEAKSTAARQVDQTEEETPMA